MANPGVLHTEHGWVNLTTGAWNRAGHIHTASELKGPWTSTGRQLLTRRPTWMSTTRGVWAPSIIKASNGTYRVFFAGLVAGESHSRCIGAAWGSDPRGPFTPFDRATACYSGSGARAHDTIQKEGPGFTLIDATPSWVGSTLVLTYKTGRKLSTGDWHTTTRMVRLDPDRPQRTLPNPRHPNTGESIKLTDSVHQYIEENPVLVKRGDRYTLFTSFGWFGTCDYWTRYRQNTSLWYGWRQKSPSRLSFPASMNTCGTGNAHVTRGLPTGSWRILFNGHPDRDTTGGPDGLYVGVVGWSSGRPHVSTILR